MRSLKIYWHRKVLALAIILSMSFSSARADAALTQTTNQSPGVYSAAALFNQANDYARKEQPGLAVLYYKRALLLAPADADISANLHFVRVKIGLSGSDENWWVHNLASVRPNVLAWFGSGGLILICLGLLLDRADPKRRRAGRVLIGAGALAMAATIGSAIVMWPKIHAAVVTAHNAPARISPTTTAEPAFILHEAETVTIRAERPDFFLVNNSKGRSGWVSRTEVAQVVPASTEHGL